MPVAFNVAFGMLAARFDYPGILRRPTGEELSRFESGGTGLVGPALVELRDDRGPVRSVVVLLSQAIVDADQTLLARPPSASSPRSCSSSG